MAAALRNSLWLAALALASNTTTTNTTTISTNLSCNLTSSDLAPPFNSTGTAATRIFNDDWYLTVAYKDVRNASAQGPLAYAGEQSAATFLSLPAHVAASQVCAYWMGEYNKTAHGDGSCGGVVSDKCAAYLRDFESRASFSTGECPTLNDDDCGDTFLSMGTFFCFFSFLSESPTPVYSSLPPAISQLTCLSFLLEQLLRSNSPTAVPVRTSQASRRSRKTTPLSPSSAAAGGTATARWTRSTRTTCTCASRTRCC